MLQRLLEELTGTEFAGPDDPRQWDCRPLLVIGEEENVVFNHNALVDFWPNGEDRGNASVVDSNEPPPALSVVAHSSLRVTGRKKSYLGLILFGRGSNAKPYMWCINGAAAYYVAMKFDRLPYLSAFEPPPFL